MAKDEKSHINWIEILDFSIRNYIFFSLYTHPSSDEENFELQVLVKYLDL